MTKHRGNAAEIAEVEVEDQARRDLRRVQRMPKATRLMLPARRGLRRDPRGRPQPAGILGIERVEEAKRCLRLRPP